MQKKRIKINFWGYPQHLRDDFIFVEILRERYEVEISDNPDYLFCNVLNRYGYCGFEGIRIFYPSECFYPDMNLFDYAITCTDMGDNERHIRAFLPLIEKHLLSGWEVDMECLAYKSKFCDYIYSHAGIKERTEIFETISEYKKVDAAGKWLNNMNGFTPGRRDGRIEKLEFQKQYKFSIAVENFSHPYYCTEKITDAFRAKSIPIYYGDPKIGEYVNEDAFINLHNYNSFEDALKDIIAIDNDDERYLKMVNAPKFKDKCFVEKEIDKMRQFLFHIFDQEYEHAFRRPHFYWPKKHEMQLQMADFMNYGALNGERFNEYFQEKHIKTIALYGRGEMYEGIKQELFKSAVDIKCIIETFSSEDKEKDGIPIVHVKNVESYKDVDAIVVIPSFNLEEFVVSLERCGVKNQIIPLSKLL